MKTYCYWLKKHLTVKAVVQQKIRQKPVSNYLFGKNLGKYFVLQSNSANTLSIQLFYIFFLMKRCDIIIKNEGLNI